MVAVLAGLLVAAGGYLCLLSFVRSGKTKRMAILEAFRFCIILFIALLLFRPEWRVIRSLGGTPTLSILVDESGSMATEDAVGSSNDGAAPGVSTRSERVQEAVEGRFWEVLEEKGEMAVAVSGFDKAEDGEGAGAGTDLNAALSNSLASETNLRAVLLLSDGDWNEGEPPVVAAQKLGLRDIPIFSVPVGLERRLPDLALEAVTAPTYGIVGENVQIPFVIRSSMDRDITTTVRLRSDSGVERVKSVRLPANEVFYDSILWRVEGEGSRLLELSFPPVSGELIESNNSQEFSLAGQPESIRVLVIETLPRWEYRFIRNALSRDPGVEVDCLLLHPDLGPGDGPNYIQKFPEELEELQKYDVVFVGDIGVASNQLTMKQTELLKGLIENQASGIVFIPGPQGHQHTLRESDLGGLLPVEIDNSKKQGVVEVAASPLELTEEGRSSLLTMLGDSEEQNPAIWRSLPGFFWSAPVIRAKAGAKVLAVHANRRNQNGRIPLIVTRKAGNGKVLFMGIDSAWRWRRGVEDLYHYRFWGQVARWMSYQRNMAAGERIRLYFSPERPKPGEIVTLTANAFDENGAPLEEGTLLLDLTAPDGTARRLEFERNEATWGSFTTKFKVDQSGAWSLEVSNPEDRSNRLETQVLAQGEALEKIGQPARPQVLEELSAVTGGTVLQLKDLEDLVTKLQALPDPKPIVDSIPLWAHWATALLVLTLLSIFWIGRKLAGVF